MRETCISAYAHQDVPLIERSESSPLFQAMFVLEPIDTHNGMALADLSLCLVDNGSEITGGFETIVVLENYSVDRNIQDRAAGLKIENAEVVDWNNYPICLTVMPGDALSIEIKYDSGCYAGSTIARVMRQMDTLLSQITGNELVSELAKLLSDSDDQQRAQQEVDYAKNIRRKLSSVRRQS